MTNPEPAGTGKLRLGGMALRNGLLVHGPTHWAAAVRAADGTIAVASGPKPRVRGRGQRIPQVSVADPLDGSQLIQRAGQTGGQLEVRQRDGVVDVQSGRRAVAVE